MWKQLNLETLPWETRAAWCVFSTHITSGSQWREKHLLFSFQALGSPSDIFAHCVFNVSNYAIHRKSPCTRHYWENNCLHKSVAGLKMLRGRRQLHLLIISCWLNYVRMLGQWVHWNPHRCVLASLQCSWWTEGLSCRFIKAALLNITEQQSEQQANMVHVKSWWSYFSTLSQVDRTLMANEFCTVCVRQLKQKNKHRSHLRETAPGAFLLWRTPHKLLIYLL